MPLDLNRLAEEEARVLRMAVEAIKQHWSDLSEDIQQSEARRLASTAIQHFVQATAPDKPEINATMRLILMGVHESGPDFDSAERVKPGNIRVNFGRFVTAVSSGVLSSIGVPQAPWTLPFAVLVVWNTLWSSLKVKVTEREAAVIWTMWTRRDNEHEVPNAGLFDAVNIELTSNGRSAIRQTDLNASLAVLERMGCVERSSQDSTRWWLREWVSVRFS